MSKIDDVRKLTIKYFQQHRPGHEYHVISNLNWHRYVKFIKIVSEKVPKNSRVLDVGCGGGQTTAMLAAERPDLEVIGIELLDQKKSWDSLKKFGCRFLKGDGQNLPFKSSSFDCVISFGVLEHVSDEDKFLSEINRVLKCGGPMLIFDLPNKFGISEPVLGGAYSLISKEKVIYHDRRYTKVGIRKLLSKNGFEKIKVDREFIIPAQVDRVSKTLGNHFNKNYLALDKLDSLLLKTPLGFFCQSLMIACKKK